MKFRRGNKAIVKHLEGYKNLSFLASCTNCLSCGEEGCTDNNVTSYDKVKDEESGREYCCFWKPSVLEGK